MFCFTNSRFAPIACAIAIQTAFTLASSNTALCQQQPSEQKQPVDDSVPDNSSPTTQSDEPTPTSKNELRSVVRVAFTAAHNGWSVDEVILSDKLNARFIAECRKAIPNANAVKLNWALLNLRKSGNLNVPTTKRKGKSVLKFVPVAEIVARMMLDRHQVSSDRIMADPDLREEFDKEVHAIDEALDLYSVRKAAFRLRKQRRLKPELITRIADWGREIKTFEMDAIQQEPGVVSENPGIYIFRDATGYLYIGQSANIGSRLQEHLEESSNFSLAKYLSEKTDGSITVEVHAFDADSQAKQTQVRRAYESELIASRKPRFNIHP